MHANEKPNSTPLYIKQYLILNMKIMKKIGIVFLASIMAISCQSETVKKIEDLDLYYDYRLAHDCELTHSDIFTKVYLSLQLI